MLAMLLLTFGMLFSILAKLFCNIGLIDFEELLLLVG